MTDTDQSGGGEPTTKRNRTNRPANDSDPDPATLPSVTPRITGPFNLPAATAAFTNAAPSPSAITREATRDFLQQKKELSELIATLPSGSKFDIQLMRTYPKQWGNRLIGGYVRTYPTAPSLEDIKQEHGGGTYYFRINMNVGGGASRFGPSTDTFDIGGDPIPPPPAPGSQQHSTGVGGEFVELAKASMAEAREAAKAAEARAERLLEREKGDGGSQMQTFLQMQQQQFQLAQKQMELQMKQMEEDRKLALARIEAQERLAREERAAAEQRLREERAAAEAKAEREAREREAKFKAEQEASERRHQEQIALAKAAEERARADADRRAQEARDAAEERRAQDDKNFQLQLEAIKATSTSQVESMKSMQTMQLQNFKEIDSMKMGFFEKAMAQKPQDPIDVIMKMKQAADIFSGKADEEDEPMWKQALGELKDIAREAGPSLLSMAGVGANAVSSARRDRRNRDDDDDDDDRRKRKRLKGRKRAKPGTVVTAELDDEDEDNLPPEAKKETNGLTNLKFPAADEVNKDVIADLLMRNIDWALEKENDATWIVNNVIKRFHPLVAAELKKTPVEEIIKGIEENIPDHWTLNSPAGIKVVREAHALLQKG